MKKLILIAVLLASYTAGAQTTGTNYNIQKQEAIERQRAVDRQEEANRAEALKPNSPSQPTRVDVSTWGINNDVKFEITNHLFGYSTIVESGQTLQGVKFTGLVNLAYYKAETKTKTGRSEGRFVFGMEFPLYDVTNNINLWAGGGATLGDRGGLYLDGGADYRFSSWFKAQLGLNYNFAYSNVAPQVSLGFVW